MSVAEKLYHSRVYHEGAPFTWEGTVVDVVRAIEAVCAAHSLTLSRWETASKRNAWVRTITYAIHTGPRAARFSEMSDDALVDWVVLSGTEGKTTKSAAWRALDALRTGILARTSRYPQGE